LWAQYKDSLGSMIIKSPGQNGYNQLGQARLEGQYLTARGQKTNIAGCNAMKAVALTRYL
jgi:hypothetical protein